MGVAGKGSGHAGHRAARTQQRHGLEHGEDPLGRALRTAPPVAQPAVALHPRHQALGTPFGLSVQLLQYFHGK